QCETETQNHCRTRGEALRSQDFLLALLPDDEFVEYESIDAGSEKHSHRVARTTYDRFSEAIERRVDDDWITGCFAESVQQISKQWRRSRSNCLNPNGGACRREDMTKRFGIA